jgi:hypothetical protein
MKHHEVGERAPCIDANAHDESTIIARRIDTMAAGVAMRRGVALAFVLALGMTGCARKRSVAPPAAAQSIAPDFLDLEPGWRLRITTPLFRHDASAEQEPSAPGTITLKAPEGFAYETAYYAIGRGPDRVLSFQLVSGTVTRDGRPTDEPPTVGWRIQPDISARLARLIYLTRLSESDHNMAIVAALTAPSLESLTRRINAHPEQACISTGDAFCAWVPAGVAVVAERMTTTGSWEPVR